MKIKGQHFLNNQEFFDAAWKWLIVDKNETCSSETGSCFYRYEEKTCVIGAFIPDELIICPSTSAPIDLLRNLWPKVDEWFQHVDIGLMIDIQRIHDFIPVRLIDERIEKMQGLAKDFNLTIPKE
jgi:hypothetical protein